MTPTSTAAPQHGFAVETASVQRWADAFSDWLKLHRRAMWILVLLSYLASYNGQWQMTPDSALYLNLGRNIAAGRGYTYNGQPNDLVYPGLPYVLAGLYKIFGSDAKVIAAADALILAAGLIVLAATFRMTALAFDRDTARVVTLGLAGIHEFYRYCYTVLTDVPFVLGVMLFLAGHEAIFENSGRATSRARWFDWGLLIAGLILAIAMRPTMIALLLVWIAVLSWTAFRQPARRPIAIAALPMALTLGLLFFVLDPRHALSQNASSSYEHTILANFTHNLDHLLRVSAVINFKDLMGITAARAAFGIPWGLWWINAILGGASLAAGLALFRVRALWGLWVAVTIAMLILIVSHDRYMIQISPLLVLGWWRFLLFINRKIPGHLGNWIFAILLAAGVLGNTLQLGNIMLRQHLRPFYAWYHGGEYLGYSQMAAKISRLAAPREIVICAEGRARILNYLSDRPVIEYPESAAQAAFDRPPLIVFDPVDTEFAKWLSIRHLVLDGKPLAVVPRNGSSPLLLMPSRFLP